MSEQAPSARPWLYVFAAWFVMAVLLGASGRAAALKPPVPQAMIIGLTAMLVLSGFVLLPQDKSQWREIDAAADAATLRGVVETFVWALPQVTRDGYTHFSQGDEAVQAFDDVSFPLALGREANR